MVNPEWVCEAADEFAHMHNRDAMSWNQQASFDKGSFASLLGLRRIRKPDQVQVFAVGDTIAALCDGDKVITSFPYQSADQFDESPQLISTRPSLNNFVTDTNFYADHTAIWNLSDYNEPAVLCVTDALGKWLLSRQAGEASRIALLKSIRNRYQLTTFVRREREARRMRRDDTTLLVLW